MFIIDKSKGAYRKGYALVIIMMKAFVKHYTHDALQDTYSGNDRHCSKNVFGLMLRHQYENSQSIPITGLGIDGLATISPV